MDQLILKAVTTATDQGTFEAVISTSAADREKDIVNPAGMVRALQKWGDTGKKIPLAWNHSGDPELQIGFIDPHSAKQVGNEVQVTGWIDQSIDAGAHAWRLVKAGTLGFSFGYLILNGSARKGGGRNIDELDVFEATATPTPMNNDTRILSFKAMSDAMSMDDPEDILACLIMMAQGYVDRAPDPEDAAEMQGIIADLQELVADVDDAADMTEDMTGKGLLCAFAKAARGMMNASKSVDEATKETESRVADPLREMAKDLTMEFLTDGRADLRKASPTPPAPKPSVAEVRGYRLEARKLMLSALSGGENEQI